MSTESQRPPRRVTVPEIASGLVGLLRRRGAVALWDEDTARAFAGGDESGATRAPPPRPGGSTAR